MVKPRKYPSNLTAEQWQIVSKLRLSMYPTAQIHRKREQCLSLAQKLSFTFSDDD